MIKFLEKIFGCFHSYSPSRWRLTAPLDEQSASVKETKFTFIKKCKKCGKEKLRVEGF